MSLFNDAELHDIAIRLNELEKRINKLESKTNGNNSGSGEDDSLLCKSIEQQSGERKNIWVDWILHKEQTLVDSGTGFFHRRNRDLTGYLSTNTKT